MNNLGKWFLALLFTLATGQVMQQGISTLGSAGPPAGVAPTWATGTSSCTVSFPTTITQCTSCCLNITAGDLIGVLISGSNLGTEGTMTVGSDTLTCGTAHTYVTNRTNLCYKANAIGGMTLTYLCQNTSQTAYVACEWFSLHSTAGTCCVLEQGPSYNDTAGSGGNSSASGGTIVTAYQNNELILGLFSVNVHPTTISGTFTAGTGYAFQITHQTNSTAIAGTETKTVTAVGSQTAAVTQSLQQNTVVGTAAWR